MVLADDRRRLLEELTVPAGVIDGKVRGIVFPRCRARKQQEENLLLQCARFVCPVLVGRDWNPDKIKAEVTKGPRLSALEDNVI